jgi:hypothetical protein
LAKPDSNRALIVAALRAAGASVVDHEGRKGEPDLVVGYRGRMWFAELKTPGKEHGVCGCDEVRQERCSGNLPFNVPRGLCACKGHLGIGNAERTTWHAQLAFAEAWQGPKVCVWTSAEQALATLTLPAEFLRLTTTCSGSSGAAHARGVVKP